MFRQPSQRLLSGFHHAGGPHGVPPPDRAAIKTATEYAHYCPRASSSKAPSGRRLRSSGRSGAGPPERSIQCVANKQCAYMLGRPCVTAADAQEAAQRLRTGSLFVGLAEFWTATVCLFHLMLGGTPRGVEYEPSRQYTGGAKQNGVYDEAALE
eukprot:4348662-Prymnesium_polylepis.1